MGTRLLELDTIQYPSASTENIQVGNNSVTFPSGISVDINGGAIDGTPIGAGTASTGAFTTLSTTGTATLPTVNIDGGNIDGSTIATSNITVGSSKTLDVSGGTLTTSTAQKQAVVDGATIEAQDLATGSGTTLPNAVQDNITRLGSVTQGTIGSGVNLTGAQKIIKMVTMDTDTGSPSFETCTGTTTKVMHNAISFSAVSGRTYIILANYDLTISSGSNGSGMGYLYQECGTSNRSRGDTAGNPSNVINTYAWQIHGKNVSYGYQLKYPATMLGFFTAGSTGTHYTTLWVKASFTTDTDNSVVLNFQSQLTNATNPNNIIISEVQGVSVTSHSP